MILVDTEINDLQKVIIHSPDSGIQRITPKRAEELLFDDIVYLPKMIEEHDTFRQILEAFLGQDNVLEIQDLLLQALDHRADLKEEILKSIIEFEELPATTISVLSQLTNEVLAEVLVTGYLRKDDHILFDPIPNFIFTRDIAVTVKDHIIITKANKEARQRENFLTRFVFIAHPLFKEQQDKLINLNNVDLFPPSRKGERVSIEGGDIMMIEKDYLLVGCSERTTLHAFNSIKNYLLEHNIVKHVVQINIPPDRSFMHIDTLFTRIDQDEIVCYKPIIYDGLGSNVLVYNKDGLKDSHASVKDFFLKEINPNMKFIYSGMGETPFQEREQWTDGCNLVAVRPGIGITYDRNIMTAKAFEKAGYQILHAEELLRNQKDDQQFVHNLKKTIIAIPSGELSRARGGSHCMTCPIQRAITNV
jgi:arginine deiminase